MRSTVILVALLTSVSTATSCKTKKATAATAAADAPVTVETSTPGVSGGTVAISVNETATATNTTASGDNQGAHVGKVSHKYRASGCPTVIIIGAEDGTEITLIPKDKLNADIDVDGQTLSFDYHPLKMPQPAGCTTGMPAEVSNITKLK